MMKSLIRLMTWPHQQKLLSRTLGLQKTASCRHCSQQQTIEARHLKQNPLTFTEDKFNGVTVDLAQIPVEKSEYDFQNILEDALLEWKSLGKRAVWLKVPIQQGRFIPVAARKGFTFHHAEGDSAMLTLWMDNTTESRLPRYATHQVGVAGFVLNEKTGEVVVVMDKHRKRPLWKFPGGLSDLGEDIENTAEREVFEETGIRAKYQSILTMRQHHDHPSAFGRSDIYIICRLSPETYDLHPCSTEISACQWMHVKELLSHEDTSSLTKTLCKLALYGLEEGFHKVDISSEIHESIYQGYQFKLFHRPLPKKWS
ncbi:nucleoside diphosphate-linked moiety X motif 6 [Lingula anatina]|uniref:Nucleoside diphosphate-linked moiety X motif 6 n=1 Tax=Lingula anatina TaxID=7574 RepID=A0A1S3IS47_LINAN|nr:nucleoside diphosphate-linked moiety X motif 6 [Lingula anatina]XP_013401035.1 nucleoside diphosphate-linked moiety X motif 6 [Lingula anatina]|eukprot:XP_013401034.1 nucleoside diphosphate-linked moiety X motif 6 [Lingula anatina]